MQPHSYKLSDKDISLIKSTFRKLCENYYDDPSNMAIKHLQILFGISQLVITTPQQANSAGILPMLEVLKVKSKGKSGNILTSINCLITHINSVNSNTKEQREDNIKNIVVGISMGAECPQLYTLSCTMLLRVIDANQYLNKINSQQQLEMIENIGKNCTVNPSLSIDLLLAAIKLKSINILKPLLKSGIAKYLMNTYLIQLLQQTAKAQIIGKLNLYRLLKFLSLFGTATKNNFVKDRQKGLVSVIFNYQQYISVVKSILECSFDSQYCLSIINDSKNQGDWIDKMYLWSYDENFSKLASEQRANCVNTLINILKQPYTEDTEVKIYAILSNLSKNFKFEVEKIPFIPKHNKSIKNALKLTNSLLQLQHTSNKLKNLLKKGDTLEKIQNHVQKSIDPQVPKIFAQVLDNIDGSNDKIKQLTKTKLDLFSQNNAQLLLERSRKIPKDKQDLKNLAEILSQTSLKGQFQMDLLEKAKQLSVQSIYRCILMKQRSKIIIPEQINTIINSMELAEENIKHFNRLIQILQIYMLKNPDWVNSIDKERVLRILDTLEKYSIKLNDKNLCSSSPKIVIDWGAVGQVLELLFGHDQWIKHIDNAFEKKRMFWLLCAFEPEQKVFKKIVEKMKNISTNKQSTTGNQMILGFLAKSNQQLKTIISSQFQSYLSKNFSSNQQYLNQFLMASYIVDKWSENQNQQIKKYISSSFIPLIFQAIEQVDDSSDHVCQFLTAALPLVPSLENYYSIYQKISSQEWLSKYGKFSTMIYDNNPKSNGMTIITKGKVQQHLKNLSLTNKDFPDGAKLMEILNFLRVEYRILSKDSCRAQFQSLILNNILRNYYGKGTMQQINWYWMLYPYYVSLMKHIIEILIQRINQTSTQQEATQNAQILYLLLEINTKNQELTQEESYQIISNYRQKLELIGTKDDHSFTILALDISKLREAVNNISQSEQLSQEKQKLNKILDGLIGKQNILKLKKQEQQKTKAKENKRKQENEKFKETEYKKSMKQEQITNTAIQQIYIQKQNGSYLMDQTKSRFLTSRIEAMNINQQDIPNESIISNKNLEIQSLKNQKPIFNPNLQLQVKNVDTERQEFGQRQQDLVNLIKKIQKQEKEKQLSDRELNFFEALKTLKKIVQKQEMVEKMNLIIPIFERQNIPFKFKDTLGYLLAKSYSLWQDQRILHLLLKKQKTLLSKQSCYNLLKQHSEAFVLSHRWKLLSHQWLDLAILRLKQPDFHYIAESCIVASYNLPNIEDIQYFEHQKHQQTVANFFTQKQKLKSKQQMMYYFLLLGTSSRLNDIRQFYLKKRLHLQIMSLMAKNNDHMGVLSNGSYALSSLIYLQSGESTRLSTMKAQFEKIFEGFMTISKLKSISIQQRSLIQSSCSLISNMTYNNDKVKTNLRQYKMIDFLMQVLQSLINSMPNALMLETDQAKEISENDLNTLRHLFRALGNCSVSELCAKDFMDKGFPDYSIALCERIGFLINQDQPRIKLLKLLMDVYANLTVHKYEIKQFHKSGITDFVINLLQTTAPNDEILMGAIDTIDGFCQQPSIQKFVIQEKNLAYILIDILKMQENQKVITKSTRLLTNLTINKSIIPKILEANLLSVLGNIVLTSHRNKKVQAYVNKIINRVYNAQPDISIILKSGYLDCLVKCIETSEVVQDSHVDIMLFYAKHLPSFLNKRAFMCLIRVLIDKPSNKQIVDKAIKIFKILLSKSVDDDEEDLILQGAPKMYQNLLMTHPLDMLFLLGSHCIRSQKIRHLLRKIDSCKVIDIINSENFMNVAINDQKNYNIALNTFGNAEGTDKESIRSRIVQTVHIVSFIIFNNPQPIFKQYTPTDQQQGFKVLNNRISCKLFRVDGTYKRARVDIDEEYAIRAYKYPEGQIKKKYYLPIRNIRDWRFHYQIDRSKEQSSLLQKQNKSLWNYTYFAKGEKGFFSQDIKMQNCVTLMGGLKWGHFVSINLQFENFEAKILFIKSISALMSMFKP